MKRRVTSTASGKCFRTSASRIGLPSTSKPCRHAFPVDTDSATCSRCECGRLGVWRVWPAIDVEALQARPLSRHRLCYLETMQG
eukprot:362000-Chlamydomonas_euryale.AAC.11